jgi:hypothetical protein
VRRRKEEEKRKKRGYFPLAQTRSERDIQRRERVGVRARREKPKEEGECSPAQPEQERGGGKKEREERTVLAGSPAMSGDCVSGDVAADRPSVVVGRPPLMVKMGWSATPKFLLYYYIILFYNFLKKFK